MYVQTHVSRAAVAWAVTASAQHGASQPPWWLVTDLSTALAAALATAAFSLVTATIWKLGDLAGWPRRRLWQSLPLVRWRSGSWSPMAFGNGHPARRTPSASGWMLDTSYMTIWRWESLQSEPTYQNVRKLEHVFGLPIETLLSNEKATASR